MGAWLTEAAPGLAVLLLLWLQRDPDAQAPPVMDELGRVLQIAAALSPVLVAAVLFGLQKYFPGRKEVISGDEVDKKIAAALEKERPALVSRLEMQNLLSTYGNERDKLSRQIDFDTRQAFNVELGRATASLREEIKKVESDVGGCRSDMDAAKERASQAASGVAQLETKVTEMDRRLEGALKALKDVLLAKLDNIDQRLDRMDPRSRRDVG